MNVIADTKQVLMYLARYSAWWRPALTQSRMWRRRITTAIEVGNDRVV
jgi:hypothetical protein